jgi:hypothetical protein
MLSLSSGFKCSDSGNAIIMQAGPKQNGHEAQRRPIRTSFFNASSFNSTVCLDQSICSQYPQTKCANKNDSFAAICTSGLDRAPSPGFHQHFPVTCVYKRAKSWIITNPEDGSSFLLRNTSMSLQHYTVAQHRRTVLTRKYENTLYDTTLLQQLHVARAPCIPCHTTKNM